LSGNVVSGISTTANITGANIIATAAMSAASISSSGNVSGGNILTAGLISATGNITGGNVLGGANVNATTHTGTTVSVTGNITGGNIATAGILSGSNNLIINSPSPSAEGGQLILAWANIGGLIGQSNSTWNIDVDGAATNNLRIFYQNAAGAAAVPITISSTTNAVSMIGSLSVNSGSGLTAIVNGGTNGVGNIGATGATFNTVFAKATTAQYADLAEYYAADADYEPGTVLSFGGDQEVTMATGINDVRVAGVVSTNPAYAMNTAIDAAHAVALALTGRVPTLVVGAVAKGDMMVTAGGGRAKACATPVMGTVIGKAVQDHLGGQGTIEIVVGRM
jgi:hypothetical protein